MKGDLKFSSSFVGVYCYPSGQMMKKISIMLTLRSFRLFLHDLRVKQKEIPLAPVYLNNREINDKRWSLSFFRFYFQFSAVDFDDIITQW